MLLYINACVRGQSRTRRLAERLLARLGGRAQEVRPGDMAFPPAEESFLLRRDELVRQGALADPLLAPARQFAEADAILMAAPYWDLSFPAALKQYIEQVNVTGVTFVYGPDGVPRGLCRARRLYYVTTAGGPLLTPEFGFGYVDALARGFWGIPETRLIKAECLDLDGADAEAILARAEAEIDALPELQH